MLERIRKLENLHIVFWLIKDASWVSDLKVLGMLMIPPTVVIAVVVTWRLRSSAVELSHNIAVICWILANSVWMTGEFFYQDTTKTPATILFLTGIAFLLVFYVGKYVFGKFQTDDAS